MGKPPKHPQNTTERFGGLPLVEVMDKDLLKIQMLQCCTLELSNKDQERLVRMFKALGSPIRFEILKFLLTHPGCITGDIVEMLPLAQSTVSQHLKVLREAGWIRGEIEGPATCYCLNVDNIAWFRKTVAAVF